MDAQALLGAIPIDRYRMSSQNHLAHSISLWEQEWSPNTLNFPVAVHHQASNKPASGSPWSRPLSHLLEPEWMYRYLCCL